MEPFRFCPELLERRNEVLAELEDAGYRWLSQFSSIDPMHDCYGIEVCGIREREDAIAILRILKRMFFPAWPFCHMYLKDFGIDPGWVAVAHRDPERSPEEWQVV